MHQMGQRMVRRGLAVKVNVGHGPGGQTNIFDHTNITNNPTTSNASDKKDRRHTHPPVVVGGNNLFRASPEQQRVATLELKRMRASTANLLSLSDDQIIDSAAAHNELRVVLHYWATRWYSHHHPYLTATPSVDKSDGTGASMAERILDRILKVDASNSTNSGDLIHKVIGVDGNAALVNLIEAYLLPCTTTGSGPMGAASTNLVAASPTDVGVMTASKSIHTQTWVEAIQNALRIYGKMRQLWDGNGDGGKSGGLLLSADVSSMNSGLNILSKLCMVLKSSSLSSVDNGLDKSVKMELIGAINSALQPPTPLDVSNNNLCADDILKVMEDVLVDAERRYHSENNASAVDGPQTPVQTTITKPDVLSYNTFLGAYARCHTNEKGLAKLKEYIQAMEALEDDDTSSSSTTIASQRQHPPTALPDSVTYNSLLYIHSVLASSSTYGERGNATAASHAIQAAAILRGMEERYNRTERPEVMPDTISYATVLHSYANVGNAREAERMLDHMEKIGSDQRWSDRVQTNIICYNSTLHGWSKSKEDDAPYRAEDLLRRMEILAKDAPERGIRPDIITYSAVIGAWARSNVFDSAERAQQLLEQCVKLYETEKDDRLKPDIVTYNSVLGAWAKRSSRERGKPAAIEAAQQAELIIRQMEACDDVQPCTISYNILLDAWSKAGGKGCEAKAEEILRNMASPDEISWNTVISGYANSGSKQALVKSLHLLKEMEESASPPSAVSYNLVMDALARKGTVENAQKVEKLLDKMEMLYESGKESIKPNGLSYNIALNAWAKSGSPNSGEKAQFILKRMTDNARRWNSSDLSPDVVSYASTIDSLANSGKKGAAHEAEQLLQSMFQDGGVAPNRITFNTVMNCIAKSNERGSAERAEAILNQMEELYEAGNDGVRPDSVSYSTVLNAWARSSEPDAADKAEAILERLEARAADLSGDPVKPNAYCYSSVLNAFSRSKDPAAPDRALALLNRMNEMFLTGNHDAQPNSFCYNAAINCLAKSTRDDKAVQSEKLLNRMLEDYRSGRNRQAKPSALTYSTILNAAAYTRGSQRDQAEAFRIARSCFRDALSLEDANGVEFAMFLLACARLSPPGAERDVLVESVFVECCRRGLVNELVLRNVHNAASPRLQRKLLGRPARDVAYEMLPKEWKCNVVSRQSEKYRQKRMGGRA